MRGGEVGGRKVRLGEAKDSENKGASDGTPLQYSCLENLMDRDAWWATVHGVAKSRTRLSNFTFTFTFRSLGLEKTFFFF